MITLLICTSLFLLVLYYLFKRKTCNLPGPKGLPLIGSVLNINIKSLYLTLYQWTKEYGDIFQFSVCGIQFVCLNSSEIIRKAFTEEPNATHLSSRPPTFNGRYIIDNYSDVVLSPLNNEWTRRRKLLHQAVHAYGEGMVHIEEQISSQMEEVVERLTKQSGLPVDPQNIVEEFILTSVEVLVAGKRGKQSRELQQLMRTIDHDAFELGNPGNDILYSLLPFLRFLPFPVSRVFQRFKKNTVQMTELFKNIANEDPDNTGIVHHLLKVKNESDTSGSKWFTDVNVKNVLVNITNAAYLTTRGTLMSAIAILAKKADVQEKIKRELLEKAGNRKIQLSDRGNCPYLEAVILETLRFISHVPLAVMHHTSYDCELKGFFIPKNTIIIPNLWTAHHSEIWGDPFAFRPERFLDDSGELLPATHVVRKRLIPFGYGKRSCIGESFAKSRIFLFLANLLQHFSIHELEESPVPELQPTDMISSAVLQPKQYKVVFLPEKN